MELGFAMFQKVSLFFCLDSAMPVIQPLGVLDDNGPIFFSCT